MPILCAIGMYAIGECDIVYTIELCVVEMSAIVYMIIGMIVIEVSAIVNGIKLCSIEISVIGFVLSVHVLHGKVCYRLCLFEKIPRFLSEAHNVEFY